MSPTATPPEAAVPTTAPHTAATALPLIAVPTTTTGRMAHTAKPTTATSTPDADTILAVIAQRVLATVLHPSTLQSTVLAVSATTAPP